MCYDAYQTHKHATLQAGNLKHDSECERGPPFLKRRAFTVVLHLPRELLFVISRNDLFEISLSVGARVWKLIGVPSTCSMQLPSWSTGPLAAEVREVVLSNRSPLVRSTRGSGVILLTVEVRGSSGTKHAYQELGVHAKA